MNALLSPEAVDIGEGNSGFILGSGTVAVLLIHGLTGTPTELRRVATGRLDAIAWRAEGTPIGDALRQGRVENDGQL